MQLWTLTYSFPIIYNVFFIYGLVLLQWITQITGRNAFQKFISLYFIKCTEKFQISDCQIDFYKRIQSHLLRSHLGFPGSSDGKASAYNLGDPSSIPGSGRSPGKEYGNPLQYSCLENPMDCSPPGSSVHGKLKIKCQAAIIKNPICFIA